MYLSVYVITKMNGSHFLPSSTKQVILMGKMKNYFNEISFDVWCDVLSYRQHAISNITWNLIFYFNVTLL